MLKSQEPKRMKEPDTDSSHDPGVSGEPARGASINEANPRDYATGVLVDLTDCTLATVDNLALKARPPKSELARQCSIAQRGIDAIRALGHSGKGSRAEDVISRHAGSVSAYADAIRAEFSTRR